MAITYLTVEDGNALMDLIKKQREDFDMFVKEVQEELNIESTEEPAEDDETEEDQDEEIEEKEVKRKLRKKRK